MNCRSIFDFSLNIESILAFKIRNTSPEYSLKNSVHVLRFSEGATPCPFFKS